MLFFVMSTCRLCFAPVSTPSATIKKREHYAEQLQQEILDLKITSEQEVNQHEDVCKQSDVRLFVFVSSSNSNLIMYSTQEQRSSAQLSNSTLQILANIVFATSASRRGLMKTSNG